jgi:signal peptidase II
VALDQASKYMVETAVPLNRHVEVIPGYLDIVHVRNPGAAFGILSQSAWDWRKTFFVSVSGIALAVILWLVAFGVTPDLFLLGGYSLFFGGTLGNLIDRLRFGEVIDFLDVHVENLHWPAFNVADSALCVGAALFFIHIVRSSRTTRESLDTST